MAEEEDKQEEEKFDFTAEGEALGYISLAQARLLAMQTARETPGNYGRRHRSVSMAFDVAESAEDEDYYNITLSFRPEGAFRGTSGREQFYLTKEGVVAHRQILDIPSAGVGWRLPLLIAALIGIIGGGAAIGWGIIAGDGGDEVSAALVPPTSTPIPVVVIPTATSVPTNTPLPTPSTATVAPTDAPSPTDTQASTNTPFLTPTPVPTYTPLPTYTPFPTFTPRPTFTPTPLPRPTPTLLPTPTPTPPPTLIPTPRPTSVPTPTPTPTPTRVHG